MKKFLCILFSVMLLMVTLAACGSQSEEGTDFISTKEAKNDGEINSPYFNTNGEEHTKVLFTMEDGSTFTIELLPEYAPITCKNFEKLVKEGFYDGLTFHRIVEGFMAQGGDPNGNGSGGSEPIKGEFALNGVENMLSHKRGVVSMARRSDSYDSGSSQFFICYSDNYTRTLDGSYAAFGRVVDGMEVIDSFTQVELTLGSDGAISKPVTPIVIKTAQVLDSAEVES